MKTRWDNAGVMLDQRRRRWSNIKAALSHRVFIKPAYVGSCLHVGSVWNISEQATCDDDVLGIPWVTENVSHVDRDVTQ